MYKSCPNCGLVWPRRSDLLGDPEIELVGYQVNFKHLETGIILFNHSCRGTLALYAADFRDLYNGPVFSQKATGSDQCPGHCQHQGDLRPCPAQCECAFVRQILQIIKAWPKHQNALEADALI